jgi:hypothetical protein
MRNRYESICDLTVSRALDHGLVDLFDDALVDK